MLASLFSAKLKRRVSSVVLAVRDFFLQLAPGHHHSSRIDFVLTCAHCGEPIDQAHGVWFHPYRRFRSASSSLPILCDFGDRVGPTHATPVAVSAADKNFLHSIHVPVDQEDFLLEALWVEWQHANVHRGITACRDCGAPPGGQHSLECGQRARMIFDADVLHHRSPDSR